jgi:hypothetical protein
MINRQTQEQPPRKRRQRWRMVDIDQLHSEIGYQSREIMLNKKNNETQTKSQRFSAPNKLF